MKKLILAILTASVFALSGANNANALQPSTPVCEFYNHNRQYLIDQIPYQNIKDYLNNSSTPIIYSLSTSDYFGDNVPIINFTYNGTGLDFYNDGINKIRITGGTNEYQAYFNTDGSFGGLQENSIYPYTYWKCVVDVSNVTYDSTYTGTNYSTSPVIDVDYAINISMQGSGSSLVADYNGYTTTPNTPDIEEITNIRWGIIDTNVSDEQSTVGYKFVCNQLDLNINEHFQSDCSGYNPIQGHIYHLIAGVYFGNATQESNINDQDYFITYKMSSIVIPLFQQGTYSNDTTTCSNQSLGGDYGFGVGCNTQTTDLLTVFNDCVTDTFPFLNVTQCSKLFSSGFQLLTFQKVTFGNDWATDTVECRQLDTFDDWLGLPDNYLLCPQFPGYIRDTITPFITFFLGLLTITYVANKGNNV